MTTPTQPPDTSSAEQAVAWLTENGVQDLRDGFTASAWPECRETHTVPVYTRAQDSGQGEAVAWLETEPGVTLEQLRHPMALMTMSSILHTGEYPEKRKPENELFPLFTYPPKPAQDAAGKGVDVRAIIANVRKWYAEDIFTDGHAVGKMARLTCDNILREYEEAIADATTDPAKPAQVGQKYRPFTLDEAAWIAEKFMSCEMKPDDHAEMLALLNKRGAVVPAQDGDK